MQNDFSIGKFLFDWHGRISRKEFWLGTIAIGIIQSFIFIFIFILSPDLLSRVSFIHYIIIIFAAYIFFAFITIVLYIKRYHDLDKSGHWVWLLLIPIIGALWILIEGGFFRGTIGSNKYGKDTVK